MYLIIIILIFLLVIFFFKKNNFNLVKIFDNMFNKRTHYMFEEKVKDEDKNMMYDYEYNVNDNLKSIFGVEDKVKKSNLFYKAPIPNLDRKSIWHNAFINEEKENKNEINLTF